MKKLLLLFIACFLTAASLIAQTGHYIPASRFSSSLISDFCQDRQGFIWVGTDYGLNRFDGYNFRSYLHSDADTTSLRSNVVTCLFCDRDGRLWIGTNHGLDYFDSARERFVHLTFPNGTYPRVSSIIQRRNGTILVGTAGYGAYSVDGDRLVQFSKDNSEQYFSRFFEDSEERLWKSGFDERIFMRQGDKVKVFQSEKGNPQAYIETNGEILVLCMRGFMSYRNGKMEVADIDMSRVKDKDVNFSRMIADRDGDIYIGTRGKGIYRLTNTHPRCLEPAYVETYDLDPSSIITGAMLYDSKGNLWVGATHKGLIVVPLQPAQFSNWSFRTQGLRLGSTISSICEGDDGVIWTTVRGVGVYGFDSHGKIIAHPNAPAAAEFLFRDKLHRYWLGTDDALYSYDPITGRAEQKVVYDCEKFNDMTSDDQGRIYISTFSRGLCIFDPQTGSLRNHNFYENDSVRGKLCNNWIMGMSSDGKGLIWMATSSGVSCYDPKTDNFRSQGWNTLLDGIVCFDVCELRSGYLPDGRSMAGCVLIGTEQGLYIYHHDTRQTELFPGSEELYNKVVCYIVQDNSGDIWCSTSNGIWQYQMNTRSFLAHINGNGLTQKEYIYGVGMHTENDHIFFAHNEGITSFFPHNISSASPLVESLQLTAFRVGDQYVNSETCLNGVNITDKAVSESDHFTVSYLDHTITLSFSLFNYENPSNVTFEYNVNDGQWIANSAGVNEFTLSHLQPGTYHITVRAKVGNQYSSEKVVVVTVRAPWYRTHIAYIIYILFFVGLIYYVMQTYRRRTNEQLNEDKMKFLINATHDIRSPLTLIMSPLHHLKRNIDASQADAHRDIDTIERNAQRILNLVNQILDMRKIDKQQMKLHCQSTDLVAFTRGICKMFDYSAKERNISFGIEADAEAIEVWIDRSQFDKVITNLLSNAFKYSQDNGEIKVVINHDADYVQVKVIDNGVGLDNENMKHIFDRFYQGNNSRRLHIAGTGIGLNLCKMIVDMHHGTIEASSRVDGINGSVFTVSLLLGDAHLSAEEKDDVAVEEPAVVEAPVLRQERQPQSSSGRYRVLVVDDDEEISNYISTELGRYYKFGIAHNGKEGLKQLLEQERSEGAGAYDIVISDVMMPEMDGFTMLRMIKSNVNISHIPVVMLTSKADVGNRLEGLEKGADAFLSKPFDLEELHLVIDNLIQNRQRLKGKFSGAQLQADKVEHPEVKGNDELLMERIMKAINKNLSDSDFNVDMLTQEVGISRAQLHRKMKEMTGISTSEFIRNIRLEQAARLLKEQKINVTQVAYTVGFSNLAHFSTIFRKHFGISPSEYAEQQS